MEVAEIGISVEASSHAKCKYNDGWNRCGYRETIDVTAKLGNHMRLCAE